MSNKLNSLIVGNLEIKIPIIQGAMGVKVSTAPLVSAVANCGGAGTISSVGLGFGTEENETNFVKVSREALQREIRQTKASTTGVVGANILVAVSNYEDLVRTAVNEKADFIVSGAGLPLRLPEFTNGGSSELIPIVSSGRAADIIMRTWKKRYNRLPSAIVVEGPLAGGHLGFRFEDLELYKKDVLEGLIVDVLKVIEGYEREWETTIPVIAAGGIFDGKDVSKFIRLGAKGVQIATRFVTTFECAIADNFKELYLKAKGKDIIIINSPVGMPERVIRTKLIDKVMKGERIPIRCNYRCLKTCDAKTAPYCIAKGLFNAVIGDLDNAIVFAGSNVSKVEKIVSVEGLMDSIVEEAIEELNNL